MKRIDKGPEPNSLTVFKSNPLLKYSDLNNGFESIRVDIRQSCITEQFYLCAYCCDAISIDKCHNEHIIPQNSVAGENLTLDYDNNIVVSCESRIQCGHRKNNTLIALTPLMNECEIEIVYQLNGRMTHQTPRAQSTISTLNLRNKGLENKRKVLIDTLIFDYLEDQEIDLVEQDYLELIIEDLNEPDSDGKLIPFSPVLTRILRDYIS